VRVHIRERAPSSTAKLGKLRGLSLIQSLVAANDWISFDRPDLNLAVSSLLSLR